MVNSVFVGEGTEQVVMGTKRVGGILYLSVSFFPCLLSFTLFSSLVYIDGQVGAVSLCQTF